MNQHQIIDAVWPGNDGQFVIGPLVWRPTTRGAKQWYFIIASGGVDGFRCDLIDVDAEGRVAARSSVLVALIERRKIIIHDMKDELSMARLCEALWPGERITRLRKAVEAEVAS